MMVEMPVVKIARAHIVWPMPGVPVFDESGGYAVHPAAAGPHGTKIEPKRITLETTNIQNYSMFSVGKIMSRAPIISGMQKLPYAPIMIGVMAKKIMIVPCIVNSVVYV
jgi:hypothetical protein